ncbi:MAG: beta-galactosidase [Ruminococcaceae bacterium]|nr:beta-galactosidase [Oscillospiraceae bacterium]
MSETWKMSIKKSKKFKKIFSEKIYTHKTDCILSKIVYNYGQEVKLMTFEINGNQFIRDGKPIKIMSGAVHYFRNLPDTWRDIFKKLRALGCNCVETYCAWNMHEKQKGVFDFSGMLDIKRFLTVAQEEGLMAIVRPGPYICSEWEFGGLPWWIQTEPDIEIRCSNETYIKYFDRYLDRLFDEIRSLLSINGGNIIMLQCENEYGYYGDDKEYLAYLKEGYIKRGMNVPLFTSDGTNRAEMLDGCIEGGLVTLNFGSDVENRFRDHDEMYPDMPKMCMEMWCGWFDAWGDEYHHTTSASDYAKTVGDMLARGSLNMYMFIGGTNFGFMNGANHHEKFLPDVTSYDYDAVLTECGDITEKYLALREVFAKYNDEPLPEILQNRVKKAYGKIKLCESAGIFANLEKLARPVKSNVPRCMEHYGIGYGYIAYRTRLNRDYENALLSFESMGDRAQIYINESFIGTVYINENLSISFSAKEGDVLTVLCENMGRANFGAKMMRKKGIDGRCLLNNKIHFNWTVYPLPMDNLENLEFQSAQTKENTAFYRGYLEVDEPCDSFIKLDNFKKGFVTVNGFNIGRYWEIGPQQTLYLPASLLKHGKNEIIVFASDGLKGEPEIEFTDTPII